MLRQLSQEEFVEALDRWVERQVIVRVVAEPDQLLAVFAGRLEQRTVEKQPALFWPLHTAGQGPHPEKPGVYLHPEQFRKAAIHVGGAVLELRHGGVTLNLRRLSSSPSSPFQQAERRPLRSEL